jgi:hypothetical protein
LRALAREGRLVIDQAALAEAFGKLDAGTRALLDLSLRRAIPDDQVAKVLGVDPTSIPPRRARGIAQLADMMEVPGPSELAALLIAIPDLPEEAWGVPTPAPFGGSVSLARRAKAFRRVAIAASPLVAVGAVMAAVVVAASDHPGPSSSSSGAAAGAAGGSGPAAATADAPETRHGLPPGVALANIRRTAPNHHHHAARHRRAHRHHRPEVPAPAILADTPAPIEHTTPIAFNPAPVTKPRHVTHHHTPAKPKHSPNPAPDQSPSAQTPTPDPIPNENNTLAVPVSTPKSNEVPEPSTGKPEKTPPAPVNLNPPGHKHSYRSGNNNCGHHGDSSDDGDDSAGDQGSWSHHGSSHHSYSHGQSSSGGKSFNPPGLFRRHHGGGGRH